jgi:hypothetical protein
MNDFGANVPHFVFPPKLWLSICKNQHLLYAFSQFLQIVILVNIDLDGRKPILTVAATSAPPGVSVIADPAIQNARVFAVTLGTSHLLSPSFWSPW